MKEIVLVSCLRHRYPDKTEVSVCGLDFIAKEGEKISLIGGNGSGKTTLLMHIIGFLKPTEGMVKVFGLDPVEDIKKIRKNLGIVVQNAEDQMVGPTVFDDIAFSLINYDYPKEEINKRVERIMKDMGIEKLKDKLIHYLSGGEKKKVALAGALVLYPKLLVLDEVLSGVDTQSINLILELLEKLNKEKKMTIIMATNDMEIVEKFSQKVYLLDKGGFVFEGTYEEFVKNCEDYNLCRH